MLTRETIPYLAGLVLLGVIVATWATEKGRIWLPVACRWLSGVLAAALAPILNSRRNGVSLGRTLLFSHTVRMILIPTPSALELTRDGVIFLVLAMYCFGDKPWVREVILILAHRNPADNLDQIRTTARTLPSAPTEPAPVPAPAAEAPLTHDTI